MKIRLIEPEPPNLNTFSFVHLPRLGLPLIAAKLKAHGHDVKIYVPQIASIVWPDVYSADIVGISTTTSTATEGYDFADDIRPHGPKVIIGGSHVTFMADEALAHADFVARGEGGDDLMLELIEALDGQRGFESIRGLCFLREGQPVHNELRQRCADLDDLPFPDLTAIQGAENLKTTPIMTSWGCPFNCNFCSVTAMFGKKYRYRSADSILAEIREKQPRKIFFYDDNMAADRRRLKDLLRRMIDEDLVIPWSSQVRTDVTKDEELLDLMKRSGCSIVYLGLESVSQETLDGYEKHQTVDDIVAALKKFRAHGINTHGMFVLGADSDTRQTLRDTVSFAMKNKIDTIMLNILTPLPGTPQFTTLDEQGRIFDKRWQLYDAHHVVFQPKNMTPYELQRDVLRGYMRFYSLRQWLKYFFTFRFAKLLFQGWGWWIIRTWRKDERNKAFMNALKTLRWRPEALKTVNPER